MEPEIYYDYIDESKWKNTKPQSRPLPIAPEQTNPHHLSPKDMKTQATTKGDNKSDGKSPENQDGDYTHLQSRPVENVSLPVAQSQSGHKMRRSNCKKPPCWGWVFITATLVIIAIGIFFAVFQVVNCKGKYHLPF